MATIRQGPAPEDHYTLIPNSLARSNEIPARAKVVYIYLKSHRDGWDITTERVAEALGMSKNTVSRALQDLEEWGFVVRSQERGDGGAFAGWEYTVLSPVSTVSQKLGNGDAPHPKKPASQKTRIPKIGTHKKTNSSKKTIFEEDPPVVPQRGTAPAKKPAKRRKTGTTLPEDWTPSPDLRARVAEKCPDIDQEWHFTKFRNYWLSTAGAKGRKSNWDRTYENWMMREQERSPQRSGTNPNASRLPAKAERIKNLTMSMMADGQDGKEITWPANGQ